MLPDPKKRKIGSKISDCLFLGYAEHNVAYRFLVLNSDIIERNTIVETKNVEFFEHIFPLKVTSTSEQPIKIANDPMSRIWGEVRDRERKLPMGMVFILILLEMNH